MLKALLATLALAGPLVGAPPRAVALEADLSHHLIAITTAFSGTDVLLFGAIEEPESDVVVIVRGPLDDQIVRRKSRIGPIWLNTSEVRFRGVPGYYAVASSRPLDETASPSVLRRHEIGVDNIRFRPAAGQAYDDAEIQRFRAALIRNKQEDRLYVPKVGEVSFLGKVLFRTRLAFPANVPPGSYQVQVLQLRDGNVINAQASPLGISKIGIEAEIFDHAHKQAGLHGLVAILVAVGAGWGGNLMFRKR